MRVTQRRSVKTGSYKTGRWSALMGLAVALLPWLAGSPVQAAKPQTQNQTQAQRSQPTASRTHAVATHAVATRGATASTRNVSTGAQSKRGAQVAKGGKSRVAYRGGGLQCVPFARNISGIEVAGNAHSWWDNAAGVYARGQNPEAGSVLSFRANRSMPLGHVAVVSRVINARHVEIDHANWAGPGGRKGSVSRGASVVDVSENNDWTAVRVELGSSGDYGSIYPTNGFIYDRPDRAGTVVAARTTAPAPVPELNAAPRDLRPAGAQGNGFASVAFAGGGNYEEVAEAPATTRRAAATPRRKPVRPHTDPVRR
jgi:surface antigen